MTSLTNNDPPPNGISSVTWTAAAFGDEAVAPAFPNLPEETLPPEPIAMHMTPDGSAWWIAGMAGYIKTVGFCFKFHRCFPVLSLSR